jgi:hypothetical protein
MLTTYLASAGTLNISTHLDTFKAIATPALKKAGGFRTIPNVPQLVEHRELSISVRLHAPLHSQGVKICRRERAQIPR